MKLPKLIFFLILLFELGCLTDRDPNLYLTKVDLKSLNHYYELSSAVDTVFGRVRNSNCEECLNNPQGLAIDQIDNTLYIADRDNHSIRIIPFLQGDPIITIGKSGEPGNDDYSGVLPGNTARFSSPNDVFIGNFGQIFVADEGNRSIRTITKGGYWIVETYSSIYDGILYDFKLPISVAINEENELLVLDNRDNNKIIKFTIDEEIVPISACTVINNFANSLAINPSAIFCPERLIVTNSENLYLSKSNSFATCTPLTVNSNNNSFAPYDVAIDYQGAIFMTNQSSGKIQILYPNDPEIVTLDQYSFNEPSGIAINHSEKLLYIASARDHIVVRISLAH